MVPLGTAMWALVASSPDVQEMRMPWACPPTLCSATRKACLSMKGRINVHEAICMRESLRTMNLDNDKIEVLNGKGRGRALPFSRKP